MMSKGEVQKWIESLPSRSLIGIDEGGLTLMAILKNKVEYIDIGYLEIGEIPEEIENALR